MISFHENTQVSDMQEKYEFRQKCRKKGIFALYARKCQGCKLY
ncbi:hypothetical protein EL75_1782 [Escherichia coli]|nr:hypothetical protein EL75_1782 [Escherichia coli]KGM73962.1 hypothetical protein EL80_5353 [Escherichia coli]KGM82924.1 hypothetical protein EL79_1819 [Escherichia coli]